MKIKNIEKKLKRKTNPELVNTILAAKKNKNWLKVANIISTPKRKNIALNLRDINEKSSDGEIIVIPGKVLSDGEINKKIKISAISYTKQAYEKLKKSKIESNKLIEEITKNPNATKIKIINNSIKR